MRASRRRVDGDGKTSAVGHGHEFRTFASLGRSHPEPLFFTTTKVPSIKHSERSSPPRRRRSSVMLPVHGVGVHHEPTSGTAGGRSGMVKTSRVGLSTGLHCVRSKESPSRLLDSLPTASLCCQVGQGEGESKARCLPIAHRLTPLVSSYLIPPSGKILA